ncbi:MAG: tripartite tricarboxylate transporter substrate binding protein [Betaproteobacteria bacterium]|nr:MAG: tripartite tricarboxylate transporter substrate binding protein [Betaproteobacteria bacterium]
MRNTLFLLLLISMSPRAAEYPTRPIRMVVAYAPGGTTDFTARVTAPKLSELLGQTVVVDNRPGAGSILGTDLVAKGSPDGYTLLMADTTYGIIPAIYSKLPFNVQKDFATISLIMSVPNALVVHPSVAARSVSELVALAKSKPGQLTFGSGGVGTPLHMAGEQLKLAAGVNMLHVPHKGAAPAMVSLLGGQITMVFPTLTLAVPQVKSGKVRALAVTSAKRAAAFPEIPTMSEAGYAAVNATSWFGLVAPAQAPKAILSRISAETAKVVKLPDVRERIEAQHGVVVGNTPGAFAQFVATEIASWTRVAQAGNIRAD